MDDKKIRDDKNLAEEILSDTELDSVVGGVITGQTNPSFLPEGIHGRTGTGFALDYGQTGTG